MAKYVDLIDEIQPRIMALPRGDELEDQIAERTKYNQKFAQFQANAISGARRLRKLIEDERNESVSDS